MKVVFHENGTEFLKRAEIRLMQNEPANTMILGLAPKAGPTAVLATLERENEVESVALQTPPFNLILGFSDTEALHKLADAFFAKGLRFPGVVGPVAEAKIFADYWIALTNQKLKLGFEQRIFKLSKLTPARKIEGRFRQAKTGDADLVCEWLIAFTKDAIPTEMQPREEIMRVAKIRIANGDLHFWEVDGTPVSMAGVSGPTQNGIRVNAVYTPPHLRGKGFASAVVSDLSAKMLASGRKFCTLYTDLANPTSNSVYTKLGYEPVIDSTLYLFV